MSIDFVVTGDIEKVKLSLPEWAEDSVELSLNGEEAYALISANEARALAVALNEKADELENKEEK